MNLSPCSWDLRVLGSWVLSLKFLLKFTTAHRAILEGGRLQASNSCPGGGGGVQQVGDQHMGVQQVGDQAGGSLSKSLGAEATCAQKQKSKGTLCFGVRSHALFK